MLDQSTVYCLNIIILIYKNIIAKLVDRALLCNFLTSGVHISGLLGSGWVSVISGKNLSTTCFWLLSISACTKVW